MDLEANDVCNVLSGRFKEIVLVKVYDQNGGEIEAESYGNVAFCSCQGGHCYTDRRAPEASSSPLTRKRVAV
jgi:hypothetical protein